MNNKLIAGIIAAIIVVGGGAYLTTHKPSSNSGNNSSQFVAKKACDLLTLTDAKNILGANTKSSNAASKISTSSSDTAVSTCAYSNSTITATVLVRAALNTTGTVSNTNGFTQDKAAYKGSDVSGVGDKAYYNTDLGQLEILKGHHLIFVTTGGLMPADHSQSQATQIAQVVLKKV
jgi:hypothetical protein